MPNFTVTQDASAIMTGSGGDVTSDWNGTGYMLPVGLSNSGSFIFRAGLNFSGFLTSAYTSVSAATLTLNYYNNGSDGGNAVNVGSGGSRTLQVYLAGKAVTNSGAAAGFPSTGYTNYSASGYTFENCFGASTFVYSTPATTTFTTTTNGANIVVDVAALLNYAISNGIVFKGFVLKMANESSNSYVAQFYSYESATTANRAVLAVTATTNTAPTAPTNLYPTAGAKVTSQTFSGDFNDPDVGDTISSAYVEISTSSSFTSPIWSSGWVDQSGTSFVVSGNASLTYGSTYYWRAKTKDAAGVESPFSAGTDTFGINTKPSTPTGLNPTGGIVYDGLTPTFSGSSSDSDPGDYVANARIRVYRTSDNVPMWDSGYFSCGVASFSKVYGSVGTKYFDLSANTAYYWRANTQDSNGAVSTTSSSSAFSTAPAGVTGMTPSIVNGTTGWVKTLTPSFNFTTPVSMDQYTLKIYDTNSNLLFTSATTAVSPAATTLAAPYVYAGSPVLTWGTRFQWTVTYRQSGGSTQPESSKSVFWTNSAPVPGNTSPANNTVVQTTNPSFVVAFNDQDLAGNGFADSPTALSVEVSTSTGTVLYTMSKTASLSPVSNTMVQGGSGVTTTVTTAATATITGAVGAGGVVTYTCAAGHPFWAGQVVTMTGITSSPVGNYNLASQTVLATGLTDTIFKVTNAATGTYTSGGTATSVATSSVPKNVQHRYRTRYTDNSGAANAQGDYSSYLFFKASTAPAIALINNGSGFGQYTNSVLNDDITSSKLNNSIPSFSYTFSGAYGKTQSARRFTISTGSNVIYDSGYSYTSLTTFDAPDGYVQNNATYVFTIESQDTDNLISNQLSITYVALWSAPAQIENIIAQEIDGSLNLTWDQSVDSTFVRYNVYRRQSSGSAWSLVTKISDKTKNSYFDFSAGVGVTYQYTVTQTALPSGSHEVDSDIAASTIVEARNASDNWWIVVENNQALAVELYVDTEARTQPYQEETFEPFGRNRKVIVRYAQYGVEGNISSVIPLDETAVKLSILKKIAELTNPVYLKTPFGDVYKVYLGIPNYSYTSGGNVNYSVTYVEVD